MLNLLNVPEELSLLIQYPFSRGRTPSPSSARWRHHSRWWLFLTSLAHDNSRALGALQVASHKYTRPPTSHTLLQGWLDSLQVNDSADESWKGLVSSCASPVETLACSARARVKPVPVRRPEANVPLTREIHLCSASRGTGIVPRARPCRTSPPRPTDSWRLVRAGNRPFPCLLEATAGSAGARRGGRGGGGRGPAGASAARPGSTQPRPAGSVTTGLAAAAAAEPGRAVSRGGEEKRSRLGGGGGGREAGGRHWGGAGSRAACGQSCLGCPRRGAPFRSRGGGGGVRGTGAVDEGVRGWGRGSGGGGACRPPRACAARAAACVFPTSEQSSRRT